MRRIKTLIVLAILAFPLQLRAWITQAGEETQGETAVVITEQPSSSYNPASPTVMSEVAPGSSGFSKGFEAVGTGDGFGPSATACQYYNGVSWVGLGPVSATTITTGKLLRCTIADPDNVITAMFKFEQGGSEYPLGDSGATYNAPSVIHTVTVDTSAMLDGPGFLMIYATDALGYSYEALPANKIQRNP